MYSLGFLAQGAPAGRHRVHLKQRNRIVQTRFDSKKDHILTSGGGGQ